MSSDARVRALQALYADDAIGADDHVEGLKGRAARMVEGVRDQLSEIDAELSRASDRWRLERMPAVDRAILRLAAWELLHTDTPMPVVISEAVELAKQYSTERSGAFVNAVLAKVAAAADIEA